MTTNAKLKNAVQFLARMNHGCFSVQESTTTGDRKAPSRPTSFLVESIKDTNVTKKVKISLIHKSTLNVICCAGFGGGSL